MAVVSATDLPARFVLRGTNNKYARPNDLEALQFSADSLHDPEAALEAAVGLTHSEFTSAVAFHHVASGTKLWYGWVNDSLGYTGPGTVIHITRPVPFRHVASGTELGFGGYDNVFAFFEVVPTTDVNAGAGRAVSLGLRHGVNIYPASQITFKGEVFFAVDGLRELPAVVFTLFEQPALTKRWTEVVYDVDSSTIEDNEVFSTDVHRFDNSEFDQPVVIRPKLSITETIEVNHRTSFSWGLEERIQVTGKLPFIGVQTEVEFKAVQTWETDEGGSTSMTTESSVEVDVPVPAFRKVVVYVVGTKGKVTLRFRCIETCTYDDGTTVQRTLENGVCTSVSSVATSWKASYYDTMGRMVSTPVAGGSL